MDTAAVSAEQREHLQEWYRQALARRASVLETLLPGVSDGDAGAREQVQGIAHALAGSGATFGFPVVSAAARVAAHDSPERALPRVLGLIDLLRELAEDLPAGRPRAGRWLLFAAGPLPDPPEGGAVPPGLDLHEAWRRVADRLDLDHGALAARIAARLGVKVADPSSGGREAALLVPPALALEHGLLPLRDEGPTIVAGTANPTDIRAMAALEATTGRGAVLDVLPPGPLLAALEARYGLLAVPPASLPVGASLDGGSSRDRPGALPTVLVVDDEPGDRLLCRTILEREGFRVVEAPGGPEALVVLSSEQPVHLVLVDVVMPGLDGRALLQMIRENPSRAEVPVIVLTGLQSAVNEVQLMERGADDYLRKPVEPRVLLARIQAALRRSAAAGDPSRTPSGTP